MLKRILAILVLTAFLLFSSPTRQVFATYDPTIQPNKASLFSAENNKFGIHILFPSEIETAAKLVNSNGGDWGYVTIPIQSTDRNLDKWQKFMDECRRLHITPIIRIATYPQGNFWTRPTIFDHLDFANFLNSLYWPTKNRYIIVYNEPNSGLEWGGFVAPAHYAEELSRTIDAFKRVNADFFIISAGLDSHAPNRGDLYKNSYSFLVEMDQAVPGIFHKIDGFASHSYPNKNFTENPKTTARGGVFTYREEFAFLQQRFGRSDIPIFITETGWQVGSVSEDSAASFYRFAFEEVWKEKNIIAVTPFVLTAHGSQFSGFSLLKDDGGETEIFKAIASLSKTNGTPLLSEQQEVENQPAVPVVVKQFGQIVAKDYTLAISESLRAVLRWFFL